MAVKYSPSSSLGHAFSTGMLSPSVVKIHSFLLNRYIFIDGLPQWLNGKKSACSAGDAGDTHSIPLLGRYLGEGNGNSLQYSCWEHSMNRRACSTVVHTVAKSQK